MYRRRRAILLSTESKSCQNIQYISFLRAVACIAIVVLHTFYAADAYSPSFTEHAVMLSVRNSMMWAVPCFVMATGSLLLDNSRQMSYKKIFGKYILRMAAALIIFSVLFSFFDSFVTDKTIGIKAIADGLADAVKGTGWKHMWYPYLMISLYLLLPFYRMISGSAGKKDLLFLLLIYFVFLSLVPAIETLAGVKSAFYICVYTVYPFYLFMGYAVHTGQIKIKRILSLILVIVCTAVLCILTVYSIKNNNSAVTSLLGSYSFPLIVLQSAGMFSFACGIKHADKSNFFTAFLNQTDKCSFGIYLIHMLFLKLVFAVLKFNPYNYGGFITVFATSVAVLAISFFTVWILRKIPAVRKVL